jgi:phosphoribosyl 1,2-cyclic phosphodiesterase
VTRLYVLGSGSKGNCLAVESEGRVLLIDAGFSAREIERRAERVGLALGGAAAIVVTHEHGDHSCGAAGLARRLGVPVMTSAGTWRRLVGRMGPVEHALLRCEAPVPMAGFMVEACATSHDAAEPLAVAVRCPDGVRVGIASDLGRPTAALRYLFRGCTALVLEANFDEVLLRTSGYPPSVQQRIAGSGGHLSNRAAASLLAELHHEGLGVVVLAHLSQRCNTAEDARGAVEPALRRAGFAGALHVALQDEPLEPLAVERPRRAQLGFDFA